MFPRTHLYRLLTAGILSFLAPRAAGATDARIGVYFDAAGTQCSGTIRPGAPNTIYILAKAAAGDRVSGAEFRFAGLPASWSVYPVPNPAVISIGNPFTIGVNIASGLQCNAGGAQVFLLYTVLVLAADNVDDVRFELVQRDVPSNPSFHCPLITGCDVPFYTMHCVRTDPCFVNAVKQTPCKTTGVETVSWSAVRGLYR